MAIAKKKPAAKKAAKKGNGKWMQKASKKMEEKGTEGSFTAWCKKKGFGGVTSQCIAAGLKAGGAIAKKAIFAKNAKKARK
jgi:ribosomal protein L9